MTTTTMLPNGIYPPLPTFFDEQEELDLATLRTHIVRLQDTGIAGYVLMGSNGEAVHLTNDERAIVIATTRQLIGDDASMPLIVGCAAQSTRSTIAYCQQAAQNGADIALILPPFYYRGSMDKQTLIAHYEAVAEQSPLPILIYNMPSNTGGLDLDAATLCTLATHPNIIGVKDSAANIVKLTQVVADAPSTFRVFCGSAGYLLPSLTVGAVGAVAALANIFPDEVCDIQALFEDGQIEAARTLQAKLVPLNNAVTTLYGVSGLKAALELVAGYGGKPRMPLQPLGQHERSTLAALVEAIHQE